MSALQRGATDAEAASYAGISKDTLKVWYDKGQEVECEYRYENFALAVDAAKQKRTTFLRQIIEDDAQGKLVFTEEIQTTSEVNGVVTYVETKKTKSIPSAGSAKWLLERHDRENYGPESLQRHEHSGGVTTRTVIEMHGGGAPISFDGHEDPDDPVLDDE